MTIESPDGPPLPGTGAISSAQCDALFAAVLRHDSIDLDAPPPRQIALDCTQQQLARCFQLSMQLWRDGIDQRSFASVLANAYATARLSESEQVFFKHVRAKFKHLRATYAVCDQRHRYPRPFHWLISLMGYLQDALKNGRDAPARRFALLLRCLWSDIPLRFVTRTVAALRPSTTASFRDFAIQVMHFVRAVLARPGVTGKEFHDARKVISRQVAHYDNLTILYPSADHREVSRYCNTLNGLMGSLHDELVAGTAAGVTNYRSDRFAIPEPIRQRLTALVACYPPPA